MEDKTVYCPECMKGMHRRGFNIHACYICGKRWYIVQEGVISKKRLDEIHKGIPADIE